MRERTCCFLGHREICVTEELVMRLRTVLKRLVTECGVDTFLFGSKSKFDGLCYEVVSDLRGEFPQIRRVYVRAEFPHINENYHAYLLGFYEETYFPPQIEKAGRAVYVERNYEMIGKSAYCVVYYDTEYRANRRKSGTKIAYEYAVKKGRTVINVCGT